MKPAPDHTAERASARIAWIPLLVGIGIMLGITAYPLILVSDDGHADHLATLLLCWAMSAGFTRGVGLVPRGRFARVLLSATACVLALGLALVRCCIPKI